MRLASLPRFPRNARNHSRGGEAGRQPLGFFVRFRRAFRQLVRRAVRPVIPKAW